MSRKRDPLRDLRFEGIDPKGWRAPEVSDPDSEVEYHLEGYPILETPQEQVMEPPEPWGETRVVGTRRPKVDAYERVSGTAKYPSDITMPGMLYGAGLSGPTAT
jgi:hypothetical protein